MSEANRSPYHLRRFGQTLESIAGIRPDRVFLQRTRPRADRQRPAGLGEGRIDGELLLAGQRAQVGSTAREAGLQVIQERIGHRSVATQPGRQARPLQVLLQAWWLRDVEEGAVVAAGRHRHRRLEPRELLQGYHRDAVAASGQRRRSLAQRRRALIRQDGVVLFFVVELVANVRLEVVQKRLLVRTEDAQSDAYVAEQGTTAETGASNMVGLAGDVVEGGPQERQLTRATVVLSKKPILYDAQLWMWQPHGYVDVDRAQRHTARLQPHVSVAVVLLRLRYREHQLFERHLRNHGCDA